MTVTALGVDFGTSHTVAVLRYQDGSFAPLLFDGSSLLPSAVFAEPSGGFLVGRDAVHSARMAPERFEPNPKRSVDDGVVLLGDREIPVTELFAAVLSRVHQECVRVVGGVPPRITVTHPAEWGPTRRLVLEDAVKRAGFPQPELLAEPVAAATYFARTLRHEVAVESAVVVYDFGGGTFDASVTVADGTGFSVRAVEGLDDLGGVDLDEAIVRRLGERFADNPQWQLLLHPVTTEQRRHRRAFYEDVRACKERLSRHTRADLSVPLVGVDIHFTREELETLTRPLLERAVRVTQSVIRASRVPPERIAGVFLVGGASRMPLAATMLHHATGRPPVVIEQPELVVAQGATTPREPDTPPPVPAAGPTRYSPQTPAWPQPVPVPPPAPWPVAPPPPPAVAPGYPAGAAIPARLRGVRNRAWLQAAFGLMFLVYPFLGVSLDYVEQVPVGAYLLQLVAVIAPAGLAATAAFHLGTRRRWVFGLAVASQLAQLGAVVGWPLLALLLRSGADVQMEGDLVGLAMALFIGVTAIIGIVRVSGRHGRAWWILPPGPDEPGAGPDRPEWPANLRSWLWIQFACAIPSGVMLVVFTVIDPAGTSSVGPGNPFESPVLRVPFVLVMVTSLIAVAVCAKRLPRARVSRRLSLLSVYGLALANLYWILWTILEIQTKTHIHAQTYFTMLRQTPFLPLIVVVLAFAAVSVGRLHTKSALEWFDGPMPRPDEERTPTNA